MKSLKTCVLMIYAFAFLTFPVWLIASIVYVCIAYLMGLIYLGVRIRKSRKCTVVQLAR